MYPRKPLSVLQIIFICVTIISLFLKRDVVVSGLSVSSSEEVPKPEAIVKNYESNESKLQELLEVDCLMSLGDLVHFSTRDNDWAKSDGSDVNRC